MIVNIPTNDRFLLTAYVSMWSGAERLELDGEVISEKSSYTYLTPHSFERVEDGKTVVYEVNILTGWMGPGYILRRDGIVVSHS